MYTVSKLEARKATRRAAGHWTPQRIITWDIFGVNCMKRIYIVKFLSHHYCRLLSCGSVSAVDDETRYVILMRRSGNQGAVSRRAPRGGARGALNVYEPDNRWSRWDLLRPVQGTVFYKTQDSLNCTRLFTTVVKSTPKSHLSKSNDIDISKSHPHE